MRAGKSWTVNTTLYKILVTPWGVDRRPKILFKRLIPLLVVLLLCWHKGDSLEPPASQKPLKIIATVFPLAEFAGNVVGPFGEVEMLLPPGAEAHSWRPRPSDLVKLAQADLIIYIGGGMEPWLLDILQSVDNPNLKRMEVSRGLDLLSEDGSHQEHGTEYHGDEAGGDFDPHVWLDFGNDQIIIQNMVSVLTEIAPDQTGFFNKQAETYISKLQALDETYRRALQKCRNRTLIIGGHAAFGYMARRYDLVQVALIGLNPDAKPTAKQLREVVDLASAQNIETIFFEELVNEDLARVLAKEIGTQILVLNPGANLTRAQHDQGISFLDLMRANLIHLQKGLGCK